MSQPVVAREALSRAADADMVLLAADKMESPPDWLLDWLEDWAIRRQVPDAVLAAWSQDQARDSAAGGAKRLRELASRHGLEWFCASDLEQGGV